MIFQNALAFRETGSPLKYWESLSEKDLLRQLLTTQL